MDYRKAVIFGENWSPSRYRVLPYFAVEKAIMNRPGMERLVDVGCAAGWNMSRFVQYGRRPIGLDVVPERVRLARQHGPVLLGSGLEMPFPDSSLDLVYIQHVLHHIGNVNRALAEVHRCLRPGGTLFLVETVEDNPIIRLGRRLHPSWMGDEINARFTFDTLRHALGDAGLRVQQAEQYSVLFWLWETLPDKLPFFEKLTPFFVRIEEQLVKQWKRSSAHCFLVATRVAQQQFDATQAVFSQETAP